MSNHDRRLDRLESTWPHLPPPRPELVPVSPSPSTLQAFIDALDEAGADYDPDMDAVVVSMEARREAAERGLSRAESWKLLQSRLAERRARERAAEALDLS